MLHKNRMDDKIPGWRRKGKVWSIKKAILSYSLEHQNLKQTLF